MDIIVQQIVYRAYAPVSRYFPRQQRVGRHAGDYNIHKFRNMTAHRPDSNHNRQQRILNRHSAFNYIGGKPVRQLVTSRGNQYMELVSPGDHAVGELNSHTGAAGEEGETDSFESDLGGGTGTTASGTEEATGSSDSTDLD